LSSESDRHAGKKVRRISKSLENLRGFLLKTPEINVSERRLCWASAYNVIQFFFLLASAVTGSCSRREVIYMPNRRHKLLPLCIAASLLSGPAAAIGIGEIHLRSFLGAPLQAEVPLSHIGDLGADQLKVQIGSQSDYGALGVEYSYLHTQLKIEPIIKNGQGYVRITTREPISEPYLNFVLNLHWPQGQIVREFTVLLDPAPLAVPAVASTNQPTTASEPQQLDMLADEATVAKPVQKPRAQTRRVQRDIPAGGYMTQRGDSLWRVANKLRPAGVSTDQMMSALHAANPAAFIKGDPARLKEAVPLTTPTAEQIAAVSDSAPQSSMAESERAVVAKAPAAESGSAATSQQQPAATLQQENAELKAQVTELTTNVTTLNGSLAQSEQRLHQLESQLNELLVQFQQQRATVAALSGTAPDARAAANTVTASGSMISQVNASDLTPPPKAHTPWWVHLMYWLGIGGVALVAIREHFWPRRLATVGAMAGDNLTAAIERTAVPVDNDWRGAGENSRYWHHEEPAASATAIDEIEEIDVTAVADTAPDLLKPSDDPVDASISAGVFVAFGRFDEAARLLGQAIEQAPDRTDLKLQLLDVYAQADQPEAFAALAAEIERHASGPEVIAELAVLRESYTGKH